MAQIWEVKDGSNTVTLREDKTVLATITGVKTGLKVVDDAISGIEIKDKKIVLSKSVLTNSNVTISSDNYTLDLDDNCAVTDGGLWLIDGTSATLIGGKSSGYELNDGVITYKAAKPDYSSTLTTLSGLKSGTVVNTDGQIDGIEVSGGTITVTSKNVLDGTLTVDKDSGYKLAVGDAVKPTATTTPTWAVKANSGTATFETKMSSGYTVNKAGAIEAVVSKDATITIKGFNKKITADHLNGAGEEGEEGYIAPLLTVNGSVITVNDTQIDVDGEQEKVDALGTALTISGADYTFAELDSELEGVADVGEYEWVKSGAKATWTRTIGEEKLGYYASGATIKKLTKEQTETIATVSGLPKEGTTVSGLDVNGSVITVSKALLEDGKDNLYKVNGDQVTGVKKLALGAKDNFTFAFDEDEVDEIEPQDNSEGRKWTVVTRTKGDTTTGTGELTFDLTTSAGWTIDTSAKGASKTISSVAPVTTNYVKLSGLADIYGDDNFVFESNGEDVYTGNILNKDGSYALKIKDHTITLNESVFGGKKISIKNNTKTGETYTLALDADYESHDVETPEWEITSDGKATLVGGTTPGYTLATDKNGNVTGINYTAPKKLTLATITIKGYLNANNKVKIDDTDIAELKKKLDAATVAATTDADGNYVIKLDSTILDGDDVTSFTLDSKSKYKFDFDTTDDDLEIYGEGDDDPTWTIDPKGTEGEKATQPKGTASYSAQMVDGYTLSIDGKTVTYKEADPGGTKLFTISGLVTTEGTTVFDLEDAIEDAIEVDSTTVTIKDASILDSKKISLTIPKNGEAYSLNIDAVAKGTEAKEQWDYDSSKGTATFGKATEAGYEFDKGKTTSASYKAAAFTEKIATITGLAKNTEVTREDFGIVNGKIYLTGDMLDSSTKGTQVKLTTEGDYKLGLAGVASSATTYNDWTVSKGTATLTRDIGEGWKVSDDGKTVNKTTGSTNQKAATLSGLNKNLTDDDLMDYIEFDENNKLVTILSDDALAGSTVALKAATKGETFTLALDTDVSTEAKEATEWTASGGTATYKKYTKGFYTFDSEKNQATYTKDTKGTTYATIKGLSKTISGSAMDELIKFDGTKITIDSEAFAEELNAKSTVTLTDNAKAGYTLALKDGQEVEYADAEFVEVENSKGAVTSAVLAKEVETAGWTLDTTGTKFIYVPETVTVKGAEVTNSVTVATVSGVTASGGLSESTVTNADGTTSNVIIVSRDALGDAKVSLGKNDNYIFQLNAEELVAGEFNAALTGVASTNNGKGTVTFKGDVSNAYTLKDTKTIEVAKAKTGEKVAEVTGLTATAALSTSGEDDDTITISGDDVNTTKDAGKVTVSSGYGYKFNFTEYSGTGTGAKEMASIAGGNNSDDITADGSNLFVNMGKGDDVLTFGAESKNNTVAYKVGDGNDVITGFDAATDKINLTAGKEKVTISASGSDAVISITDSKGTEKTAGTITLVGMAGKITSDNFGGKGTATIGSGSADLAVSPDKIADNYFDASPQLGEILGTSYDAISADNFSATPDYTKLAQQQTVVYGTKK